MQVSKSFIHWIKAGTKGGRKTAERFLLNNGFEKIEQGTEKKVFHKVGLPFVVKVHCQKVKHKMPKGLPASYSRFFAQTVTISRCVHLQEICHQILGSSCGKKSHKLINDLPELEEVDTNHYEGGFCAGSEVFEFNTGLNSVGRPVILDC